MSDFSQNTFNISPLAELGDNLDELDPETLLMMKEEVDGQVEDGIDWVDPARGRRAAMDRRIGRTEGRRNKSRSTDRRQHSERRYVPEPSRPRDRRYGWLKAL